MFCQCFIKPRRVIGHVVAVTSLFFAASHGHANDIAINGADLAYSEAGSGEVVLFVHGAVSDHRIWEGFSEDVAEQYRFVAYDQRYFGHKSWHDDARGFSVATHADDLIAVIDALGGDPVHLVTWSYGGLVGLHAAQRHPEKFRSMVHYEPTVEALHSGLSGERAATAQKFASFGPMADALQSGDEAKAVRRLIEAVFRMETGAADGFPDEAQAMWDTNARTLPPFLEALGAAPLISCDALAAIDVPTLVMQGGDTYVLDAMMADEVVRCLPDAEDLVIDGANHGGPVQQPEVFIEAVLSFISSQK